MVTVSIGVAVYPIDGRQADELIQRTQGALNAVQEAGGGNYQFPASG
jgi:GGDEF domain-containing protein